MSEVRTDDRPLNSPSPEVRNDRPLNAPTPEIRNDREPNPPSPEIRPRGSVEEFTARLRSLGASDEMVAAVKRHWDDPWDDEQLSRDQLTRASDEDLRALITDVNREYREGTLTEDEEADQAHRAAVVGYRDEAEHMVTSGTVEAVLGWVGNDAAKAEAALLAEQTVPDHTPRKTLVSVLEDISGVEADAAGAE